MFSFALGVKARKLNVAVYAYRCKDVLQAFQLMAHKGTDCTNFICSNGAIDSYLKDADYEFKVMPLSELHDKVVQLPVGGFYDATYVCMWRELRDFTVDDFYSFYEAGVHLIVLAYPTDKICGKVADHIALSITVDNHNITVSTNIGILDKDAINKI